MGFKEKWKLMKRLDQSLLDQAALLGAHPTIEGVYRLQSLADTHCTLKTRHRLTLGEVQTLSEFADPLEVAHQCRMVNGFAEDWPICALLDEMNAYERFPLADAAASKPSGRLPKSRLKSEG